MATIYLPETATGLNPANANKGQRLTNLESITAFLAERGIPFEQWEATIPLSDTLTDEAILSAYEHCLTPLMNEKGYQTADVINVHAATPSLEAIRAKFLKEHTHSEDEVRFFVQGEGYFWFNLEDASEHPVFCVHCTAGDFLAVPANKKHWFDLGPFPHVKVIRIFTDVSGWVPHYTESGIDQHYQWHANTANKQGVAS